MPPPHRRVETALRLDTIESAVLRLDAGTRGAGFPEVEEFRFRLPRSFRARGGCVAVRRLRVRRRAGIRTSRLAPCSPAGIFKRERTERRLRPFVADGERERRRLVLMRTTIVPPSGARAENYRSAETAEAYRGGRRGAEWAGVLLAGACATAGGFAAALPCSAAGLRARRRSLLFAALAQARAARVAALCGAGATGVATGSPATATPGPSTGRSATSTCARRRADQARCWRAPDGGRVAIELLLAERSPGAARAAATR